MLLEPRALVFVANSVSLPGLQEYCCIININTRSKPKTFVPSWIVLVTTSDKLPFVGHIPLCNTWRYSNLMPGSNACIGLIYMYLSYCVMQSQAVLDVSPLIYVLSRICEMEAESQHVGNVSTNVPYMLMFFVSTNHILLPGEPSG